jgi:N-acetylmuramoyl-L-alanine amidase
MKKPALILDVPHGIDVPGKQSPDGKFKEWKWGREVVEKIYNKLIEGDWPFDYYAPFLHQDTEPGLRKRVWYYNEVAENYSTTVMISVHVDAYKGNWWNGTGFSFYTKKGEDINDVLAGEMIKAWRKNMPGERIRVNSPVDPSKDANYTVLYGYQNVLAKYYGILVENWFMDSKIDIKKLTDPVKTDKLVQTYILAIINIFEYLGFLRTIPETTIVP